MVIVQFSKKKKKKKKKKFSSQKNKKKTKKKTMFCNQKYLARVLLMIAHNVFKQN